MVFIGMKTRWSICVFVIVVIPRSYQTLAADLYADSIKPMLAEKCVSCHGPLKAEAGLRLDAAKFILQGTEDGQVVSRERPDTSLLLKRVSDPSVDERMPPKDEGTPLNSQQIELLRQWIANGAVTSEPETVILGPKDHWAFRPIVRPKIPEEDNHHSTPIDRLIGAKQKAQGVQSLSLADPATLLRRMTFDLIGLPPTPEEILEFTNDQRNDVVQRKLQSLLARSEYGERWGRHWMDVWRYSDWDGYKQELRGSQRHIWHWRDWIIESLNANKPYDQMIREMIAGDELAPNNRDILRATGFLARSYHRSNRNIWLDATVEHTAKAFLGMTINCARCHDHKYDPIGQDEYYQFRAIFEPHNVRTEPFAGEPDLLQAGIPRVFDADPTIATYVYMRGNEKQPIKDKPMAPNVPQYLSIPYSANPVPLPRESYLPDLTDLAKQNALLSVDQRIEKAEKDLAKITSEQVVSPEKILNARLNLDLARAARESLLARYTADELRQLDRDSAAARSAAVRAAQLEREHGLMETEQTFKHAEKNLQQAQASDEKDPIKRTGAINKAKRDVEAARVAYDKAIDAFENHPENYTSIGKEYPHTSTGRRLALANWITDKRNPLTARVAVNHIWMRHFGQPLVDSVFDFGMRTPEPVLCDLLDWLAAELIDSGWDMKHLHYLIVSSQVYQLASAETSSLYAQNEAKDPDNLLFWRTNVRRLDAEQIRDSMLSIAGALDRTRGGPDLSEDDGETIMRRSLYFRHAYEKQMAMMVLFDAASPTECYRRSPSIIPQQALVMSNSSLSRSLSRRLAQTLSPQFSSPDRGGSVGFIKYLFAHTLGRSPSQAELDSCLEFLIQQTHRLSESAKLHLIGGGATPQIAATDTPWLRARESLAHVMFNHNDFVNIR